MIKRKFDDEHFLLIENVRLSFPHLFEPAKFKDNTGEPKHSARFILDPEDAGNAYLIDTINAKFKELIDEKFKGKPLPDEKLCMRDGEYMDRPEYEGKFVFSASTVAPPLVLRKGSLEQATSMHDAGLYAGCYVDAKIRLWVQNNDWGKRINSNLVTVRFRREGESFDGSYVETDKAVEGFNVTDIDGDELEDELDDVLGNAA